MRYRLYNDDGSDYCDYEGETIEGIREQAAQRITLPTWTNGWSKQLD